MEADENCRRIEQLTQSYLREVAHDASGWDVLYIDPGDGQYWELTHPQSHMHGGGPSQLARVSRDQIAVKYGNSI